MPELRFGSCTRQATPNQAYAKPQLTPPGRTHTDPYPALPSPATPGLAMPSPAEPPARLANPRPGRPCPALLDNTIIAHLDCTAMRSATVGRRAMPECPGSHGPWGTERPVQKTPTVRAYEGEAVERRGPKAQPRGWVAGCEP